MVVGNSFVFYGEEYTFPILKGVGFNGIRYIMIVSLVIILRVVSEVK